MSFRERVGIATLPMWAAFGTAVGTGRSSWAWLGLAWALGVLAALIAVLSYVKK